MNLYCTELPLATIFTCCSEVRRLQELRRIIQEECDGLLLRKERLKEEVGLVAAAWPPDQPHSMGQQHYYPSSSHHSDRHRHAWAAEQSDVWVGRHEPRHVVAERHDRSHRHAWPDPQPPASLWHAEHAVGATTMVAGGGGQCDAWTQVPVSELEGEGGSSEALSDVARAYKVEVWFGIDSCTCSGHVFPYLEALVLVQT